MADELPVALEPAETGRSPSGLRVSLLGPMQVECDGRRLHVAGPQRRRLLALLACRVGHVVSADALIDAMWGDDPPATAAKTLQSHVVRLRQSLAPAGDPIETGPGGYRLAILPEATDVGEFERCAAHGSAELRLGHAAAAAQLLEAALELWRGPALMEFADDEFARSASVALEERRHVAIEDLAEARLATGDAASVVVDMEHAVATSAGRERAWALLMRALYATGRQRDALAAYQRAHAALREQFGLEPGPQLRELEQRIVTQDPTLPTARMRAPLPTALRTVGPLIGRADELGWVHAAWQQCCTGVGQVRSVLGDAGSGRTRLIAELASTVVGDGGSVEYVPGATGLHVLDNGRGPGSIIDVVADRCREAPLLLVVDDVRWTPPSSIEAIRSLASAADRMMLLLVLLATDADGPGLDLVRELDQTCATSLRLAPLPDADVVTILRGEGVDDEAIDVAVAVADGLPGVARREAAAWAERMATDRLSSVAARSIDAQTAADDASATVIDEVMRLVEARARRAALTGSDLIGRQPYRSLASYEAVDADLFVGRERLVAELTARVVDRRLVAVVGASGTGKSSIVRAGLLPLARSGRLPGGTAWRATVIVPGDDPLAAIDAATALDDPGPQLLVIDQFEEVLETDQLDAVATRLLDLLFDPALDARVVLAIRADRLGAIASSRALAEVIEQAQMLVGPPSTEELRRILVEPARRTGCTVEPELVSNVLADVAGHDAALPLVSAAMAEVWERRLDDTLLAASYIELGGLAAAVERLGDRAVADVGAADVPRLRDVMLSLVDVTDEGTWVRRRIPEDGLPPGSGRAVDALVDARLVTRVDGSLDVVHEVLFTAWPLMASWLHEARADLVLERDIRAAARIWDDAGRTDDGVLRGGRLQTATEWAARSDRVSELAAALLAASHEVADQDHRSVREQLARERRGSRRLRGALAVAAVLLVGAVAGSVVAVRNGRHAQEQRERADEQRQQADGQRQQADEQRRRADDAAADAGAAADLAEQRRADAQTLRLVAESRSNLDRDLPLSLLLAVEANRDTDSVEARGALLSALSHNVSSVRAAPAACCAPPELPSVNTSLGGFIAGPARAPNGIVASADGKVVATSGWNPGSSTGQVLVFDTDERTLLRRVSASRVNLVLLISMSPDGHTLLITDDDGVRALSVDTGELVPMDLGLLGDVPAVNAFFTNDGTRIVVAAGDGGLHLFDASSLRPLDVALPHTSLAGMAPDGTLAIAGSSFEAVFVDVATGHEVRRVPLEPPGDVQPANYRFSSDMRWLVGGEPNGRLVVWDLTDGSLVGDPNARPQVVGSLAFDPSTPAILAIGTVDGLITMYDVAAERTVGRPARVQVGAARQLTFSADGRTLFTVNDDGMIALWHDSAGPTLLSTPIDPALRFFDASADASVVVVGDGQSVDVRRPSDPTTPSLELSLPPLVAGDQIPWWDLSADGSRLLGGILNRSTETHDLVVFDSATGEQVWAGTERLTGFPQLSRRGNLLALPTDSGVRVRDIDADVVVRDLVVGGSADESLRGFVSYGLPTFSADDATVTVSAGLGLAQFDLATGSVVWSRPTPGGIAQGTLAVADEGDTAFAAGLGGLIWRVDANADDVAVGRSRDGSSLGGVSISSDGGLVASAHWSASSVALFDGETMVPMGDPIPTGDVGEWSNFVLTDDGKRLLVNGPDNHAVEWNLDVDTWAAIACHTAGRNLTAAEFATYFGDDTPYRVTCPEWRPPDSAR